MPDFMSFLQESDSEASQKILPEDMIIFVEPEEDGISSLTDLNHFVVSL